MGGFSTRGPLQPSSLRRQSGMPHPPLLNHISSCRLFSNTLSHTLECVRPKFMKLVVFTLARKRW
eukprot:m.82606 g.82606  ORF g.82606 m.82606 type:complete len:65 (+) comp14735_c0_seq3:312-506(+)